jgi:hypothetical protein
MRRTPFDDLRRHHAGPPSISLTDRYLQIFEREGSVVESIFLLGDHGPLCAEFQIKTKAARAPLPVAASPQPAENNRDSDPPSLPAVRQ